MFPIIVNGQDGFREGEWETRGYQKATFIMTVTFTGFIHYSSWLHHSQVYESGFSFINSACNKSVFKHLHKNSCNFFSCTFSQICRPLIHLQGYILKIWLIKNYTTFICLWCWPILIMCLLFSSHSWGGSIS